MKDKLEQHHGLQLSALMDGELAPDEARFLLRRLQHDGELAGCWERWQLAGEVLRGRAGVLLPDGFAGRVATALHAQVPGASPRRTPGLLRWGGAAALAASVAVVALMLPRPAADPQVTGGTQVAAAGAGQAPVPARAPQAEVAQGVAAAPTAIEPPVVAAPTVTGARVLASTDRPARAASRGPGPAPANAWSRGAAASERGIEAPASQTQVASQVIASQQAFSEDPFGEAPLASRPWPRAVLPQFGNGGALATGLPGNDGSQAPSFYPFDPRLPPQESGQPPESGPDGSPPAPY